MSGMRWSEIEPLLERAMDLQGPAPTASLDGTPDDLRRKAVALLSAENDFGIWAAETAARIVTAAPRLRVPCMLSHYEVLRPIASGGMGEIYEGNDPRLGRKVAIKVLRLDAVRPLDEEARALARLRHPNICRVYDVGHADGVDFLVMELLDGVPLAERIRKGPLPLADALSIGRALANALAEAHRIGIVHRDVKPSNILLTRNGPSLIDFGIAALVTGDSGLMAGTPPYMAPEQARGICDPRADIYSLGAVLRELVTEGAPEPVRRVVDACLREDPDERWQSASDLARALDWLVQPFEVTVRTPWWKRWSLAYLTLAVVATAAAVWIVASRDAAPTRVLVPLTAPLRHAIRVEGHIAVSPNGMRLAFIAPGDTGDRVVWVRSVSDLTAQAVPGTVGAALVFWSPDSESIGLVRATRLQTIHLATGALRVLADRLPAPEQRAVWGEDGYIVYSSDNLQRDGVIYRVAASGGALERVTALSDADGEREHGFPVLLRNGNFLFVAGSNRSQQTDSEPGYTYLANFKNPSARTLVLRRATPAGAVGDRVYFVRERKLWSRLLDPTGREWKGEVRLEIADVDWAKVTPSGVIVYLPTPGKVRPAWVDSSGRKLADVPVPEGETIAVGVSRDGAVLVTREEDQSAGIGLWVVRGTQVERIGSGPGRYIFPTWSGDGKWIYFGHVGDKNGVYRRRPTSAGDEELVVPQGSKDGVIVRTSTRDGRYAFGVAVDFKTRRGFDIFRFDTTRGAYEDWSATDANETLPRLSPDDRWMAWLCEYMGKGRLCVSPRDNPRNITYVSRTQAFEPEWSHDGRHLYFSSNNWLYSVPVKVVGGKVVAGEPQRLFQLGELHWLGTRYAPAPDGRFLVKQMYSPPPDPVLVWDGSPR